MTLTADRPTPTTGTATLPRPALPSWLGPRTAAALATGAAVAGLAVLGVVLRLWLLAHDPIDADQAVVGLMARAIDHGHFPAFFWGQAYGGAEPYVAAVGVALFGLHPWVVDATPAVLAAVAAGVACRLGQVLTGSRGAGAVAGAVTWVWSEADLWNSTREYGFRGVVLVCSLLVMLATARLVLGRDGDGGLRTTATWWPWLLLGAAAGLGWWASPEILYVALPAAAAAVWVAVQGVRRRGALSLLPVGAAGAAAVVASLPWLVASIHDGFASLSEAGADQGAGGLGYGGRLQVFFVHTLPMVLGARLPVSGAWLGGIAVGAVVLGLTAVVLGTGLVAAAVLEPPARVVVAAVALYPFLAAAMGPTFYWEDGRYGMYLPPLLVVAAVAGWYRLVSGSGRHHGVRRTRRPWPAAVAGVVLGAMAAASTVAGLDAATAGPATGPVSGFAASPTALTGNPDGVAAAVVRALLHRHLDHVYANYWAAYDLDLVGGERVQVTPPDIIRVPALATAVARARTAAWLFVGPTPADVAQCGLQFQNPMPDPFGLTPSRFSQILALHGIGWRTVAVGPMVAVVPAINVPAAWVAQHLSDH